MALRGSLATMSVPEVLSWLDQSARSGLLSVDSARSRTTLSIETHRVTGCLTTEPPILLGQFLLFHGAISEEMLRGAMDRHAATGVRVGEVLLEMGSLTSETLEDFLEAKAEETVLGAFDSTQGTFEFDDEARELPGALPVGMRLSQAVAKGTRRLTEGARARATLESPGRVPGKGARRPTARIAAAWPLRSIYDAVNGERTIEEIALHVHGTRFQVLHRLYELYQDGFIELIPVTTPEAGVSQPSPSAVGGTATPAGAALHDRRLIAVPTRIAATIARLTTVEKYLLSRCDGTRDVRSISTLAPIGALEVDAVLRSLLARGLVEIDRAAAGDHGSV